MKRFSTPLAISIITLVATNLMRAESQTVQLSWENGSVEATSYFRSLDNEGLCLVVEYKNNSKREVYLEKPSDPDGDFLYLRVMLDSDLVGNERPKDWKLQQDAKDNEVTSIGYLVFKTLTEKLLPGDTIVRKHFLEKKYPQIAEVHSKSPIYVMWSKRERIYPAAAAVDPLVKTRIGGFYIYKKSFPKSSGAKS